MPRRLRNCPTCGHDITETGFECRTCSLPHRTRPTSNPSITTEDDEQRVASPKVTLETVKANALYWNQKAEEYSRLLSEARLSVTALTESVADASVQRDKLQAERDEAVNELAVLSSWLGAGIGDDTVPAVEYGKRIRWGVDHIVQVETERRQKAECQLEVMRDLLIRIDRLKPIGPGSPPFGEGIEGTMAFVQWLSGALDDCARQHAKSLDEAEQATARAVVAEGRLLTAVAELDELARLAEVDAPGLGETRDQRIRGVLARIYLRVASELYESADDLERNADEVAKFHEEDEARRRKLAAMLLREHVSVIMLKVAQLADDEKET